MQCSHLVALPIFNTFLDDNTVSLFLLTLLQLNATTTTTTTTTRNLLSLLFEYCLFVEIISANEGAWQVQDLFIVWLAP